MSNPEIDALVAEKVMGWTRHPTLKGRHGHGCWVNADNEHMGCVGKNLIGCGPLEGRGGSRQLAYASLFPAIFRRPPLQSLRAALAPERHSRFYTPCLSFQPGPAPAPARIQQRQLAEC